MSRRSSDKMHVQLRMHDHAWIEEHEDAMGELKLQGTESKHISVFSQEKEEWMEKKRANK